MFRRPRPKRNRITRRALLASSATLVGAGIASGLVSAQPRATQRANGLAARLTGPALLDAFVRMRGRLDGQLVYGWLRSQRSAMVGSEITPLCQVIAGAVQRFERLSANVFEATILEVAHYTDPATGRLLETVTMPGTQQTVRVPAYRFGPIKARFAVALDEWEEFEPSQGGSGANAFVPRSAVHLVRSLEPAVAIADRVTVRAHEYGRVHPDRSGPSRMFYREWMIWSARAADLAAISPWVAADYSYTAMTSWRPWMQMGDIPGATVDSGHGAKATDWSGCPSDFLEMTRQLHPDILDNPERALRAPPK